MVMSYTSLNCSGRIQNWFVTEPTRSPFGLLYTCLVNHLTFGFVVYQTLYEAVIKKGAKHDCGREKL